MLTKGQIQHIIARVKRKRLKSFRVEDELIDYVACQVEDKVMDGQQFDEALHVVLEALNEQEIARIPKVGVIQKPNSLDMFLNYFKIAIRNFTKHKVNTGINLLGLVLSISAAIFIGLYLKHEFSYDNMYPDVERIYRVNTISHMGQTPNHNFYTAPQLAPALKEDIPEVELSSGLRVLYLNKSLKWNDKSFFEYRMSGVDRSFWDMMGFEVLKGDLSLFEKDLNNILLSQSMSTKVFGDENPLGEIIIITPREGLDVQFKVIGVFEDIPTNSHFYDEQLRFDVLTSTKTVNVLNGEANWRSTMGPTYIKVKAGTDEVELNKKINEVVRSKAGEGIWYENYVQPIRDAHLNRRGFQVSSNGDLSKLYTFSIIGILILIIACVNYVNITTAQASGRLKEVGIRKVIGARKRQFVAQFLVEAMMVSALSAVLSVGLVSFALPVLNSSFGLNLGISLTNDAFSILIFLAVMFLVSLLCGTYPGVYLSRLSPNLLLRSVTALKSGGGLFRKVLVVLQYATSIALIIATLVILNQLSFMSERELGFDKEEVVYIGIGSRVSAKYGETLQSEINRLPGVISNSLTGNSLGDGSLSGNGVLVGDPEDKEFQMHQILAVDLGLKDVLQIELVEGRWFAEEFGTDREEGFIVNEAFIKHYGLKNPIGMKLIRNNQKGQIIGVSKDFHFKSMHHSIEPLVMHMASRSEFSYWNMAIRLNPNNATSTIGEIEKIWESVVPELPFKFSFLDEKIDKFYKKDRDFAALFSTFSGLAIVVSCLGLIGLVAFTTHRKTKEIGVRKVLGASIGKILALISREFIQLIVLGALVAIPLAYFFAQKWLEGFEYRIEISYWTFVLALVLTMIVSWISVSYISFKAARSNPVESLRSE